MVDGLFIIYFIILEIAMPQYGACLSIQSKVVVPQPLHVCEQPGVNVPL